MSSQAKPRAVSLWRATPRLVLQPQTELGFYHPRTANTSLEGREWKQENKQMAS